MEQQPNVLNQKPKTNRVVIIIILMIIVTMGYQNHNLKFMVNSEALS